MALRDVTTDRLRLDRWDAARPYAGPRGDQRASGCRPLPERRRSVHARGDRPPVGALHPPLGASTASACGPPRRSRPAGRSASSASPIRCGSRISRTRWRSVGACTRTRGATATPPRPAAPRSHAARDSSSSPASSRSSTRATLASLAVAPRLGMSFERVVPHPQRPGDIDIYERALLGRGASRPPAPRAGGPPAGHSAARPAVRAPRRAVPWRTCVSPGLNALGPRGGGPSAVKTVRGPAGSISPPRADRRRARGFRCCAAPGDEPARCTPAAGARPSLRVPGGDDDRAIDDAGVRRWGRARAWSVPARLPHPAWRTPGPCPWPRASARETSACSGDVRSSKGTCVRKATGGVGRKTSRTCGIPDGPIRGSDGAEPKATCAR